MNRPEMPRGFLLAKRWSDNAREKRRYLLLVITYKRKTFSILSFRKVMLKSFLLISVFFNITYVFLVIKMCEF